MVSPTLFFAFCFIFYHCLILSPYIFFSFVVVVVLVLYMYILLFSFEKQRSNLIEHCSKNNRCGFIQIVIVNKYTILVHVCALILYDHKCYSNNITLMFSLSFRNNKMYLWIFNSSKSIW